MKQLRYSVLVILLLVLATLLNVRYLEHFVLDLTQTLLTAQQYTEAGDFKQAAALTRSAQDQFDSHAFYLHITLHHQAIDEIEEAFGEVQEYLRLGENGSHYAAANSRLLTQLSLLSESEQPTLKNIL